MQAAIGSSTVGDHAIGADSPSRGENLAPAQINPTALSDVPTDRDEIGFTPYTRAIAWFLSNDKTKAPLTISIEGPWGSGKSSFMFQLEKQLEQQSAQEGKYYFIKFNAWRSDKDEALWAAFALTFIKQLKPKISFFWRVVANVLLLWRRLDWKQGWLQLVKIVAYWSVILALTIYAAIHPDIIGNLDIKTGMLAIPWLAAAYFGLENSKKIFQGPLSYDLLKYVKNVKYEDKVAFIDRFQDDFANIVKSYVGVNGRIFVFIDDLDRCEVPRAAELLQAINLLLSADQGNLFFILGLDREMVAAAIAAKNEKLLPYLAAGRSVSAGQSESLDFHRVGIEYAHSFMEKFIQVSFRVPRPDEREIVQWVSELTGSAVEERLTTTASPQRSTIDIRTGGDPIEFEVVTQDLARLFGFNPRRLKQFVNLFRLRILIALSTGILTPAQQQAGEARAVSGITIKQLGLLTAVLMKWPGLTSDLMEEPTLLSSLIIDRDDSRNQSGVYRKWSSNQELRDDIDFNPTYSLRDADIKPLLMIMPDAYFGELREGEPGQRTRLVSRASDNIGFGSQAANTPTGANTESFVQTTSGATGPSEPA